MTDYQMAKRQVVKLAMQRQILSDYLFVGYCYVNAEDRIMLRDIASAYDCDFYWDLEALKNEEQRWLRLIEKTKQFKDMYGNTHDEKYIAKGLAYSEREADALVDAVIAEWELKAAADKVAKETAALKAACLRATMGVA